MSDFLSKRIQTNEIYTLGRDSSRWSKGQNKSGLLQRTLELKKDIKIPYVSHLT